MNYPTLPSRAVKPVSDLSPTRAAILAEKYCCNWHNHVCVGTDVDLSTGLQVRWRPEGSRCLLADGKRCPYFEASVLPMEHWHLKSPLEGAAFQNAAHQYRIRIVKEKTSRPAIRRCPDCQKNTIGPRHRFCGECKSKRRTVTKTTSQQQRRKMLSDVGQLRKNGS
jgi:hypothetical protein